MPHYVYIIQSESTGLMYKGYTAYPDLRLQEHNYDKSRYTSGKGPWKIVYLERLPDKTSALKREKMLKRANAGFIAWLINQECNLVR